MRGTDTQIVYPSLRDAITSEQNDREKPRICIITQDIVGPIKNGGIGTAYTYAAKALAAAGYNVTIGYSLGGFTEGGNISEWIEHYGRLRIELVPIPDPDVTVYKGLNGKAGALAYKVYEWLKKHENKFDLVHVSEWRSNGFYCLLAKKLGLAFQNIQFVVKASSPTLWSHIGNNEPIASIPILYRIFTERMSIEWADYVISGSSYMLNWMRENGYCVPEGRSYVQPNLFPIDDIRPSAGDQFVNVRELVFFGRLEPRKGLHIYVDALDRLFRYGPDLGVDLTRLKFTFLGKYRLGTAADRIIDGVFHSHGMEYEILSDMNQPEALNYLRERYDCLAIMPSLMDNSPFGVYECLAYGIPFITSTAGGGKELIDTKFHETVLFEPLPEAIYVHLMKVLKVPFPIAKPGFDFRDSYCDWISWHSSINGASSRLKPVSKSADGRAGNPLVSICIAHFNRPRYLAQALQSIGGLNYTNIEVIVVDDGSTDAMACEFLSELEMSEQPYLLTIVRQPNKYLGCTRNAGARAANGEYLLFMDDDNCAKPDEIEIFLAAMEHSGADILTCFSDSFEGEIMPSETSTNKSRILFFGSDLASGLYRNPFGDSNCFVSRRVFDDLGGFTEDYKVGRDDQEFFARAVLSGKKLYVVPEALYWYRVNKSRMRHNHYNPYSGLMRVLRPYLSTMSPELVNAIRYAQSLSLNRTGFMPSRADRFLLRHKERLRRLVIRYPLIYSIGSRLYYSISGMAGRRDT